MIELRHERMSPAFEKWHIIGLPIAAAVHHFTAPDTGDPHDHPWPFTSFIISGGYVEEVFGPNHSWLKQRDPGESHFVEATHIHKIIELPEGECWTLILQGEKVREPGFWRWLDGMPHFRQWDWPDFVQQAMPHG